MRTPFALPALLLALSALLPALLVPGMARAGLQPTPIWDLRSDGSGYPAGLPLPPRTLALTIDDGPGALSLELGQALHDRGIRATFFVVGDAIAARPDAAALLGTLTALGHRIGNHTETHLRLPDDPARAPEEVAALARRIAPFLASGLHPFRPPNGAWSAAVHAALVADGRFANVSGPFKYEINGQDWSCFERGRSASACADDYLALLAARPERNGILLLHEHEEPADPGYHREVILTLVDRIAALPGPAFTWVTLDAIPGVEGGLTAGPGVAWSAAFSDAAGFAAPAHAASLRAADVDGDGRDDACARSPEGVVCALSDGTALGPLALWSATFSDAAGFDDPSRAGTLVLADVSGDGRADLCLRAPGGVVCETSNGLDAFEPSPWTTAAFSDAEGYAAAEGLWRSLRAADVDGDGRADLCARHPAGVRCALSQAGGFAAAAPWSPHLGDAEGFAPAEYGATLQLGDLDGDGRADLCARGPEGLRCGLSDGTAFAAPEPWLFPGFTDAEGFAVRSRALSIRLGDVDGDGRADACGRAATGIVCARSDGTGFRDWHHAVNTAFLDLQGWDDEGHGPTLMLARPGGPEAPAFCGRSDAGLVCHAAALDPDGDGLGGARDNCPGTWNPTQDDADADGEGDLCDEGRPVACGLLGTEVLLLLGALGCYFAFGKPRVSRVRAMS